MRRTSPGWRTPVSEPNLFPATESVLYEAPRQEMVDFIEDRKWRKMKNRDIWTKAGVYMGLRAAYTIEKMALDGGDKR